MSPEQETAIAGLERALKKCRRAGIRIRGQGSSLTAWSIDEWEHVEPLGTGEIVDTALIQHAGAYVDSGADDQLFGVRRPTPTGTGESK